MDSIGVVSTVTSINSKKKNAYQPPPASSPLPPPPPPPPPPPQFLQTATNKSTKKVLDSGKLSPSQQNLFKKKSKKQPDQNLPPTPPAQHQQHTSRSVLTPKNSNQITMPPSFLLTPTHTPKEQSNLQKTSRIFSKSVDSPRNQLERSSSDSKRTPELLERLMATLSRRNSNENINASKLDQNNKNDANDVDKSLSILKKDTFKMSETVYFSNSGQLEPEQKSKLYSALLRQQELRKQQQEQQQQQLINENVNDDSRMNNGKHFKFDNFSDNLSRPTPDDKRRYFLAKNKMPIELNDSQHLISPNKKLNLSTVSILNL